MAEEQKQRKWSSGEEAFLQLVYGFEDLNSISNILNRTNRAVQCKANKIGLNLCKGKIGNIPVSYYKNLERRAKERNIEFNIGIKYLSDLFTKQKRKCIYSGIRIYLTRSDEVQTASLDRIDSSKGYVAGNVQWLHKSINFMKQSLSHDKFLELVTKIYKYCGEKYECKATNS